MKKMRMEPGEMMKYVSDFSEILLESQEQNGTILPKDIACRNALAKALCSQSNWSER